MSRITQRLNGLNPLSYIGFNAYQPTDIRLNSRDPLTTDRSNVTIGTWWLNTQTNILFYLASLSNGVATWINTSSAVGGVQTLTGNSGGAVSPDVNNTINLVGDTTTINVVGDPVSHTLTVSAADTSLVTSLTGNSGGPVDATAGNTNILGTGIISVAGNPGTSTLTISQTNTVATSFPTQSGTATPVAGVLNVIGSGPLSTIGVGNTVTAVGGPTLATSFITNPPTGTAVPSAGALTFASGTAMSIAAAGSTVTFTGSGSSGGIPSYSTGSFVPSINSTGSLTSLSYGTRVGSYVQIGDVVFVKIYVTWAVSGGTGQLSLSGLPFPVSTTYGSNIITSDFHIRETTDLGFFSPIPTPNYLFGKFTQSTDRITFFYAYNNNAVIPMSIVYGTNTTQTWFVCGWYYK